MNTERQQAKAPADYSRGFGPQLYERTRNLRTWKLTREERRELERVDHNVLGVRYVFLDGSSFFKGVCVKWATDIAGRIPAVRYNIGNRTVERFQ